jgi:DNA repair ATPase RecN
MRQIVKDRVARIDSEIALLKEEFAIRYAAEQDDLNTGKRRFFGTANGSKMIFERVEALNAKREAVINKAIFGSMQQTKYERGLEDRKFNYEQAMLVQKNLMDDLSAVMMKQPFDEQRARELRRQLGNANRAVAVYSTSLSKWIEKKQHIQITLNPTPLTVVEQDALENTQVDPDSDVQDAINAILAKRTGSVVMASNKVGMDLLLTQPGFVLDELIESNDMGDNKNNDPNEL